MFSCFFCFAFVFYLFFVLFVVCVNMHVVQGVCSWCVNVYGEYKCMLCIILRCSCAADEKLFFG